MALNIFAPDMPVLLRINHERKDVIFQVLTEKPSIRSKLEVFLGGNTFTFLKSGNQWALSEESSTDFIDQPLMEAVAKALALRFRISSSQHV